MGRVVTRVFPWAVEACRDPAVRDPDEKHPKGFRILALQPRKLSPGWEVDFRAQGHTAAGPQRAGNPDS